MRIEPASSPAWIKPQFAKLVENTPLAALNPTALTLVERKARLASLLHGAPNSLRYNDHQIGHGPAFHRLACERGLEGIVSKRTNGRDEPNRRTWLTVKCLNRE